MLRPFWVNYYKNPDGDVVGKTPITRRFCFVNRELAGIYTEALVNNHPNRPLAYRVKVTPKVSTVGYIPYVTLPPSSWLDRPWR